MEAREAPEPEEGFLPEVSMPEFAESVESLEDSHTAIVRGHAYARLTVGSSLGGVGRCYTRGSEQA